MASEKHISVTFEFNLDREREREREREMDERERERERERWMREGERERERDRHRQTPLFRHGMTINTSIALHVSRVDKKYITKSIEFTISYIYLTILYVHMYT